MTDRTRAALARTRTVISLAVRRRDSRLVAVGASLAYLLAYLWMVGDLAPGLGGVGVAVARDPFEALLRTTGPLSFAPAALVRVGPLTYLVSLNTVVGLVLAVLVGLNLGLTYLARTRTDACGVGSSSAVLAAVPALLSGTACCGPVLALALGVQASGWLLAAVQVLVPLAVVVLAASLVLVGRQIRPDALENDSVSR